MCEKYQRKALLTGAIRHDAFKQHNQRVAFIPVLPIPFIISTQMPLFSCVCFSHPSALSPQFLSAVRDSAGRVLSQTTSPWHMGSPLLLICFPVALERQKLETSLNHTHQELQQLKSFQVENISTRLC